MKLFALVALFGACAFGVTSPVVRDASCAAASNTCTLSPTPASGDLVIVYAFRSAITSPTLPSGWTQLSAASGTGSSFRSGCQRGTGLTSIGTWTNATDVVAVAYKVSNIKYAASATACGGITNRSGTGADVVTSGSASTTMNYPAIPAFFNALGINWVITFGANLNVAACAPTAMTSIASVGAGPGVAAYDTNGGVTSFASHTCTVASSSWRTETVEILADQCGGVVYGSWTCVDYERSTTASASFPSNTSGNLLVACTEAASASPINAAPTDTVGNAWLPLGDNFSSATPIQARCFHVPSCATSAGTNTVTFTSGSTAQIVEFHSSTALSVLDTNALEATAVADGSGNMTSLPVTTSTNNQLIFSALARPTTTTVINSASGGDTGTILGTGIQQPTLALTTLATAGTVTPTAIDSVVSDKYGWGTFTFSTTAVAAKRFSLMTLGVR